MIILFKFRGIAFVFHKLYNIFIKNTIGILKDGKKMKNKRKVIIDCDLSHDDAFALMLGIQHLDVLGITTAGGSCGLEKVTNNALKILEVIERTDIPVYPGHAMDFIIETLKSTDNVTLMPTGPLTNIASALNKAPEIANKIKEICLMGGAVTSENWTLAAELNIFMDPEAAHRVFNSGIPLKMAGINFTRQCAVFVTHRDQILKIPTRTAKFAAELINFFMDASKAASLPAATLHDACAAAWLIRPELVISAPMHITVELEGEYTRGMTVRDYCNLRCKTPEIDLNNQQTMYYYGKIPNAESALRLDFPGFWDLLCETLRNYP